MLTSVTLAPALDSALNVNWYPAIETELDPKVMDWLELPVRIVKPVGASCSRRGRCPSGLNAILVCNQKPNGGLAIKGCPFS
jgi:hypothetical protein